MTLKKLGPYVAQVDVEKIITGLPWQPRTIFADGPMKELADSIRESGVIELLHVYEGEDGTYNLVSGERRLLAAKMAGLNQVPCYIFDVKPQELDLREHALLENMLREDLTPMEEARALRAITDTGVSQNKLAKKLGRTQGWISQRLTLLELPEEAQTIVDKGQLPVEKARELVMIARAEPETAKAILEPASKEAKKLQARIGWMPEDVPSRIDRVMEKIGREKKRADTIEKTKSRAKAEGKDFIPWPVRDDKQHEVMYNHSEELRIHDASKLPCTAYTVDYNDEVQAVCTDPPALRKAVRAHHKSHPSPPSKYEIEAREERKKEDARKQRVFDAIATWLDQSPLVVDDMVTAMMKDELARFADPYPGNTPQISSEAQMLAQWFRLTGKKKEDRHQELTTYLEHLNTASTITRAWFLSLVASHLFGYQAEERHPTIFAWLESIGFEEEEIAAQKTEITEQIAPEEEVVGVDD